MPSGRTGGHKKFKFGKKMRILAKRQESLLSEEIAKLLGTYRSSFNHLVATPKNPPPPPDRKRTQEGPEKWNTH